MSYYLYILYSEKLDRYYVGATGELSSRLDNHLWSKKGFTSTARDWQLKYSEVFELKVTHLQGRNRLRNGKAEK